MRWYTGCSEESFLKRQQQLFLETITGRYLFSGNNYIQEQSATKLLKSEIHLNKRVRRGGILERNIARNNKLRLFSFK